MLSILQKFSGQFSYRTHSVKSVHIRSFFGPYFPKFGLNTEIYSINLRNQSKCGKIRTRNSEYGHFSGSAPLSGWFCTSWNEVTNWIGNTKAFVDQNKWKQMPARNRNVNIGAEFSFLSFLSKKIRSQFFSLGYFLQKHFAFCR